MRKITKKETNNFRKKIKEIDNQINLFGLQIYDLQQIRKGYESFLEKGVCYDLDDIFPKKKAQKTTTKK